MGPGWKVPGYTELRGLGSGGFGDVVLARHHESGVLVAVKYLRSELLEGGEFAEMFRGEAEVLASLDDPNVVRLYEYVESPSGAAIVMELIGGVSLREILRFQGKTTAEAALVVLRGSLLGLAAAHGQGVVHRDYKPENVLVDGAGLSKLTDFGIAARAGDRPFPAGTLAYAAPEQMAGASATPAGDVYSAMVTFYECLTGRPPFGGSEAELLRQHRVMPVPLEPLPEPLRPLLAAGMAKDPKRRPADATALVSGLATIAEAAYGPGWLDRGRSHLGEAALALAALWPEGAPPAVQGSAVHRMRFGRITPVKAVLAAGALAAAATVATALAVTGSSLRPSTASNPIPVHSIALRPPAPLPPPAPAVLPPLPTATPTSTAPAPNTSAPTTTSPTTSTSPTKTTAPITTTSPPTTNSPIAIISKDPSPSKKPSPPPPSPSPTPSPSPSPSPSTSSPPPPPPSSSTPPPSSSSQPPPG
jgi:eukaryotic-like serine/threonine-protein kinase